MPVKRQTSDWKDFRHRWNLNKEPWELTKSLLQGTTFSPRWPKKHPDCSRSGEDGPNIWEEARSFSFLPRWRSLKGIFMMSHKVRHHEFVVKTLFLRKHSCQRHINYESYLPASSWGQIQSWYEVWFCTSDFHENHWSIKTRSVFKYWPNPNRHTGYTSPKQKLKGTCLITVV